MSVSETNFQEGPELFNQEKYWSEVSIAVEPSPEKIESDFKRPLSERISGPIRHDGIYATYRLDDVDVRVPSEAFRTHQMTQWSLEKKSAEDKHFGWAVTAIGLGTVGALGLGVGLGTGNPLALIFSAVNLVCAAVSYFFIMNANSDISKADAQIKKWNEFPVMKIGRERNIAHERGFPYIYSNQLKLDQRPSYTGRLHPKQVELEYKKYFEAFCQRLLDETCSDCKSSWMAVFSDYNPLSSKLMEYGLGEIPEHLKPVTSDYDRLASFLHNIRKSYEDLKSEQRKICKERIDNYQNERMLNLKPLTDKRDSQMAVAKANRDQAFKEYPLETQPQHQEARRTFEAIKKALDEEYAGLAAPTNAKYDRKIKDVEKTRDNRIQALEDQKSNQLANNFNAAHDLLKRARLAWENKEYQPVNFNQYFPWQTFQQQPVYYTVQQPVLMPVQPQPFLYSPIQQGIPVPDIQQGVPPTYIPVYQPEAEQAAEA